MSILNEIAWYQGRRDEVPNQLLAKKLSEKEDRIAIDEIAAGLMDKNASIASDCLKVLYEIGYLKPALIAHLVTIFLDLLKSRNNRMVWGAMIALSTLAELKATEIGKQQKLVLETIASGTVITQVSGIRVLVGMGKANEKYRKELLPVLLDYLEQCRPIDFATRTETILPVIRSEEEKETVLRIIEGRKANLSEAQGKKLTRVLKKLI